MGHVLLVVCSNDVSIVKSILDTITITAYVTACNLKDSFIFDMNITVIGYIHFPVFV